MPTGDELSAYQTQMVDLAQTGVYALVIGLALVVFLVAVAVVRHL
jgi:hypothetical protein